MAPMIGSFDITTLLIAVAVLAATFWIAARTRSRAIRTVLLAIAALLIALMVWNLATHGGFHAV